MKVCLTVEVGAADVNDQPTLRVDRLSSMFVGWPPSTKTARRERFSPFGIVERFRAGIGLGPNLRRTAWASRLVAQEFALQRVAQVTESHCGPGGGTSAGGGCGTAAPGGCGTAAPGG